MEESADMKTLSMERLNRKAEGCRVLNMDCLLAQQEIHLRRKDCKEAAGRM